MNQHPIPFLLMRGGTSRGPYFRASDLPVDRKHLGEVLMAVIGAGNERTIDGLGGGSAVTTKVAILAASEEEDCDVDYLFAQVAVHEREVDFAPTCGNILAGVGPAAIELGLVGASEGRTRLRIRAVNTGALIRAEIQTPQRNVRYDGTATIDGVPGTAAPVELEFLNIIGSRTGRMFPTGSRRESIEGVDVTCIDVAMPMMIVRGKDLGLEGYESPRKIDSMKQLLERIECMRLEAGRRMGLGDVARSVIPKVGLIASPRAGGHLAARYLMPWRAHPSLAVTGSQCLTACILVPGTVGDSIAREIDPSPALVEIEHPAGCIQVRIRYRLGSNLEEYSATLTRTARLIARGEVMVPGCIWHRAGRNSASLDMTNL